MGIEICTYIPEDIVSGNKNRHNIFRLIRFAGCNKWNWRIVFTIGLASAIILFGNFSYTCTEITPSIINDLNGFF